MKKGYIGAWSKEELVEEVVDLRTRLEWMTQELRRWRRKAELLETQVRAAYQRIAGHR